MSNAVADPEARQRPRDISKQNAIAGADVYEGGAGPAVRLDDAGRREPAAAVRCLHGAGGTNGSAAAAGVRRLHLQPELFANAAALSERRHVALGDIDDQPVAVGGVGAVAGHCIGLQREAVHPQRRLGHWPSPPAASSRDAAPGTPVTRARIRSGAARPLSPPRAL